MIAAYRALLWVGLLGAAVWPGVRPHAEVMTSSRPSYFEQHQSVRLPSAQLPTGDACRIWYPERPARLQPAPLQCDLARGRVEPTGWLIAPGARPGELEVAVFDEWHPGRVAGTGVFDARTGQLLRLGGSPSATGGVRGK